jgi:hypothetical protein
MYNGHGLPEGMYYTEGSEEVEKYLSVREFGNVLIERYRLYGEEAVKNDIYIFSACYQENFIMNLTAYLASRNCPPSIFISASERNLVARDTLGDYIGDFEATTLGMEAIAKGQTNEFITIGTILDNESRQEHANPTVFIPVEGHINNLLQISQANPDTEALDQTSRTV